MLENIVYHSVIIIFIVILLVYILKAQKKCEILEKSLLPFVMKKEFILPTDRSLFIRGQQSLEYLLANKLDISCIKLDYDKTRNHFFLAEFDFFFKLLFNEKSFNEFFQNQLLHKKIKQIIFIQNKTEPDTWKFHLL